MTPHRFLVLDGMRGIAAFAVLWVHAGYGFGTAFYPRHGYLAVDFFFALSGFVVAHAYEARIASGLGFGAFARVRLIRLYPMLFAGAVLGALAYDPGWRAGGGTLALLNVSVFLVLPLGLLLDMSAFPVNTPIWSLFFELAANAAYWATARRPRRDVAKALIFLVATGVVLAVIAAMVGGLRAVGVASPWAFLAGIPRTGFSYAVGVLMFRYRLHERAPQVPDFIVALALAVLLAVPACGWWYDMVCVLLAFPLLLALGAQAWEMPGLNAVWGWCGALSYPVYVIHEPLLRAVYRLHGPYLLSMVLAIAAAWALLRWYDEPLRRSLARRRAPAPG